MLKLETHYLLNLDDNTRTLSANIPTYPTLFDSSSDVDCENMEAIERDIDSQLNHSSRFTSQTTRRRTGSLDQLKDLDLSLSGRRRSISLERQVADNQESAHSKTGLQPPIEYSTIMNSKISKALWFVNHKRVKFDEEYHCYLIKDENEYQQP